MSERCARTICYCDGVEPHVYRIVRFFRNGRQPRTIKKGLTLSAARSHCSDERTRKEGVWFDGYDYMKGCRP
jgi:hypothetical protein